MMPLYGGIRIIESAYLVEDGPPIEVPRTWRERLFTLPWQPRKRTKTVITKVPAKHGYRMGSNTIVMHPETARQLRESQR